MQINTLRPSHRFVLRALISVQKPARVIEFGAGLNSTQMLHELAPSFTSYESDPEWLDKIKTEVPGVDIRPLPLDVASYRIYPYQVPPETQRRIQADIARRKADQFDVIPLCPLHHRNGNHGEAIHAGRRTWEAKFGTELELMEQATQAAANHFARYAPDSLTG